MTTLLFIMVGLCLVVMFWQQVCIRDINDDFADLANERNAYAVECSRLEHASLDAGKLHKRLNSREVRIYELWVENNKLKDDLAFYQLRMGHLAVQLCECRGHLSPQPERN